MEDGILSAIGSTPLIRLKRLFPFSPFRLYAKLEFLNPGGSAKDRPALYMIRRALEEGRIDRNTVLIESSSGNLGISLAQICSRLQLSFLCIVDPKTTEQNIRIMKAYGAQVVRVEQPDAASGEYLPARLQRVRELLASIKNSVWLNQYENEYNARAHYDSTMREMAHQLGRIDYLFCAISSCGTIRGCADFVHEFGLQTKIIAVDAEGSRITGDSEGERLIPGLGAGIRPPLYEKSRVHDVVRVRDWDSVQGCRKLLTREAIFAGGSSGAVVSALEKYRKRIEKDAVVAVLFPDRGERYLDTIYNDDWVRKHLLEGDRYDLSER